MSGSDAEARRQRLGSLSAGLTGKAPRKRAEEVLGDLAPRRVTEPIEDVNPATVVPEPAAVPTPAAVPQPAAIPEPDVVPESAAASRATEVPEPAPAKPFARDSKPGVHRVVMNLPIKAAEVLNRARGHVGRTHAEVVFVALEQAVREGRLADLVRDYESPGSEMDFFQRQTPRTGGGVVQIQLRLSDVNRDALDRLVTFADAKSRTALVAAALIGFRF